MFKLFLLCLVAFVATANAAQSREHIEAKFFNWMTEHGRKYASGDEFVKRLAIFAENDQFVEEHNADKTQTYTVAHNQFSDMTNAEFVATYLRAMPRDWSGTGSRVHEAAATPSSWDWEDKGAVTGVKDQGQCGSCWSFSSTGGLEGAYQIKYGKLESFSEQQLVSCDTVGNSGCNGGSMDLAYTWWQSNSPCYEDDYPYTSGTTKKDGTCDTSCSGVYNARVSSHTDVKSNDESALASAVYQQPTSVAVDAAGLGWQMYSGGVMTGRCGTNLDHGVLTVGYGSDSGTDYWRVKNSWGTGWGEDGYIRLEKGKDQYGGQCGILLGAVYPTL